MPPQPAVTNYSCRNSDEHAVEPEDFTELGDTVSADDVTAGNNY